MYKRNDPVGFASRNSTRSYHVFINNPARHIIIFPNLVDRLKKKEDSLSIPQTFLFYNHHSMTKRIETLCDLRSGDKARPIFHPNVRKFVEYNEG